MAAVVAQSVRGFIWTLDFRIPTAIFVKIGSDSSTAKRLATVVNVTGVLGDDKYKRMPGVTVDVAR